MIRILSSFVVALVLASTVSAQDCNQSYSKWEQKVGKTGRVYYFCYYRFDPKPGETVTNIVVWYPTKGDYGNLYYTNGNGDYWCRALNDFHEQYHKNNPQWNVIAKKSDKLPALKDIPATAWGKPEHPKCPGSDTCLMLKPPTPPKELFAEYLASQK